MREKFMIDKKIKLLLFLLLIIFGLQKNSNSFENKIIYKINNEIITTIDLKNEINYLLALNPSLKRLNKKEIFSISKKSIVREKIKKIEILNQFKDVNFPQEFLDDLIKNVYTKIGKKNLDEFKEYLKSNNVEYKNVLKKIETEALWNELIFAKFSKKIKINEDKLRKDVIKNKTKKIKSYLMSEILFEISENEVFDEKYKKIINSIKKNGFGNTALKFSISETASLGGKLDWINENSLNKSIRKTLNTKKNGEFTDAIRVPGGFLILKINEIKVQKLEKNIEAELKKLINSKRTSQLNQFSKLYFNKIKENIEINEV
jgi:peptidyl-prolyl cis-trans isomerase SurA